MSFAGRLALGIAKGLSGYYGEQAKTQAEERRADILLQREKALATFQSDLRRGEAAVVGEETRKTYRDKVSTDVAGEVALLPHKTKAELTVVGAKAGADAAQEQLQQTNRERLAVLTSSLDMNEARQKAALDLANELTVAGKKAAKWEVTNDGAMVAFNERGEVIGKTPKNVFVPPSRGDDDDLLGSGSGRGGRPILTPKPSGISPTAKPGAGANQIGRLSPMPGSQLEQALADLGQFYPNATPERFPQLFRNGKKIPIAEAERIVRARFGG